MAKSQKRSNREIKKPKKAKIQAVAESSPFASQVKRAVDAAKTAQTPSKR